MSYQLVKYFQQLGDLEEACRIAKDDWKTNPDLGWPRKTIAWLLIGQMKNYAKAYGLNRFFECTEELLQLHIPSKDEKLWSAAVYPIRNLVDDSIRMEYFTPELGDRIFNCVKEMPIPRPSDAYSALLKIMIALGQLWPKLPQFIEWWGEENFTAFDRRRYPINGEMTSLVEQTEAVYKRMRPHS